jgi:hypothetical protein
MHQSDSEEQPSRDSESTHGQFEKRFAQLEERLAVVEKRLGIRPRPEHARKLTVRQTILKLKDAEGLKEPCTLRGLCEKLEERGYPTEVRNLTRPLRDLVRDDLLFKKRDKAGLWRYSSQPFPASPTP